MGGGSWSDSSFASAPKGAKAFAYSRDTLAGDRSDWKCHQMLDPRGLKVRESRDSAEHPQSNAIMVGLDVTGSMTRVVIETRDSLGKLMDILLGGEYLPDPQMLFYAVGDATCDRVPFQVSQFESDNRIETQVSLVVLEGGGGGQKTESYELGFYCAVKHTSIDCLEKRGRKGYLFSIGDEMPYPYVSKEQVKNIFGASLQEDIPVVALIAETRKKYHVFHIIPKGSNNFSDREVRSVWRELLGAQSLLLLKDPSAAAETIALAIGLNERRFTFAEGEKIIAEKSNAQKAAAAHEALADFAAFIESQPAEPASRPPKKGKTESGGKENGKDQKSWKL